MTRTFSWLLMLVLFGTFLTVAAYLLRARAAAGHGLPDYSVYSAERDGLAAAAHLLRQLGWEPIAVTRPIAQTRHRGLLLVVEPTSGLQGEGTDPDTTSMLHWVEQGNTLLLCARRATALHQALNVVLGGTHDAGQATTPVALGEETGYTEGVGGLVVEGDTKVAADAGLPLWWLGDDPAAVLLRRGRGRILIVGDPSLLTLRGLHREDNALFLINLARRDAREGCVYFDEYHHGLRAAGGFWGYLKYHGRLWIVLPALLLAGMAGWAVGVRLGPAVPMPAAASADAVEYASAVARIYQRAGVQQPLARTLVQGFLTALARHLRRRPTTLPAEMLAAWRQRHPGDTGQRLEVLLRGVSQLRRGPVSERQLLAWTRALDQFEVEVLRAG
jgi:hypothetical protein